MDDHKQPPEVQSPLQRDIVIASLACFVSLIFVYWIAGSKVERLGMRWVELLLYSVIPIFVTFAILYRSCWHPEIIGGNRVGALLLLSGVILGGVLLATGVMLCMVWFSVCAVSNGPGPG